MLQKKDIFIVAVGPDGEYDFSGRVQTMSEERTPCWYIRGFHGYSQSSGSGLYVAKKEYQINFLKMRVYELQNADQTT